MTYTPGPWTIERSSGNADGTDCGWEGWDINGRFLSSGEIDNIALVTATENPRTPHSSYHMTDEDKANARLIAASPDLLAALRQLMEWEGYDGGPPGNGHDEDTDRREHEVWQDAQDAIDKATGGQEEESHKAHRS